MGVKKLRPMTPGTRNRIAPDFADITASSPEKSLVVPAKRSGGRNNTGKMTMRYYWWWSQEKDQNCRLQA